MGRMRPFDATFAGAPGADAQKLPIGELLATRYRVRAMSAPLRVLFAVFVALPILAGPSDGAEPEAAPAETSAEAAPDTASSEAEPAEPAEPELSEEELAAIATARAAEERIESLHGIIAARVVIADDLASLQKELESDAAVGRQDEITAEITDFSLKLEELDASFTEIAAGVETDSFELEPESEQIDLGHEMRELLGPLIKELKSLSSRPSRGLACCLPEYGALSDLGNS